MALKRGQHTPYDDTRLAEGDLNIRLISGTGMNLSSVAALLSEESIARLFQSANFRDYLFIARFRLT
jgi:hypothetical protein